jgi:heme oxygenase (mycobilin-producing)
MSQGSQFVVISSFVVVNGMTQAVRDAFRDRPHMVDGAPGFLGMHVMSPDGSPDEIWLCTYWTDRASYETWHTSHAYHASHKGIPRGLKLDPRATSIRTFELFAR